MAAGISEVIPYDKKELVFEFQIFIGSFRKYRILYFKPYSWPEYQDGIQYKEKD